MTLGARAAGALLIVLGVVVMAGWWLRVAELVRILPDYAPMVFNTALSFVLAGVALAMSDARAPRYRPIPTIAGILMVVLSTLVLVEHSFQWDIGIDSASLHSWLPDAIRDPGRISVATALALALGGAVLVLSSRVGPGRRGLAVRALTLGVGAIGLLGIVGYLVHARLLFPDYFFAGIAIHTAIGLVVLSVGLRSAWRRFEWAHVPLLAREDDQVTFVGALILGTIALAAGIASFAILQDRVQTVVSDDVLTSLQRRTEMIQDVLQLREVNASIAATRPGVLRNLRVIRAGRDDGSNLANIEAVIANFLQQGFSGLAYKDVDGRVVAAGGAFVHAPAMAATLASPGNPQLLWQDGFVLRHELSLRDETAVIGTVVLEQPLPVLTRLSRDALRIGSTGDMGLCVWGEETMQCFPQRLNPRVFTAPFVNLAGEPLPMTRALAGESGVVITRDYRGENVVAAHGPVGKLGLGMVVKVDAAEIFQPIRERLQIACAALIILAAVGTILLRQQVKPIATKLLEAKRTLQGKNLELENANLAKDRFLASMSHELRTPLNAIIGFTGTLLMKLPGPLNAAQERQLKTVKTSARHLLSLINDLLDLAKIEAGKVVLRLEPTACQTVIEEVAASLKPQADEKGLRLDVTIPPADLTVRTDRRVLSQIILNLASNAIKFTDSGKVHIDYRDCGSGQIAFAVSDTGIGIRAEDQEKLFAAFAQVAASTNRRAEGTGLGLHLSRKLAELLGGRLTFESEYGKGSTFTLTLAGG